MTKELIGAELDAAVAQALGIEYSLNDGVPDGFVTVWQNGTMTINWSPSRHWSQGGPIIERERIDVGPHFEGDWEACVWSGGAEQMWSDRVARGPTPLIAAMRAYISSKGK